MIKIKNKVGLLFCFFAMFRFSVINAQDWKKDMLTMNNAYLNATSFSMNVSVNSFAFSGDKKPMFSSAGKVASSDNNYFTSMMGRISISNNRCALLVDNGQKMIIYKKNENKEKRKSGFSLASLDSAMILMEKKVKVKYLVNNQMEKRIEITYKEGAIVRSEIVLDPQTYLMKELVYYYNASDKNSNSVEKVVVTYSDVELNKVIPDSYFSESNYLSCSKKGIKALKKYEKYEVVNQSHL